MTSDAELMRLELENQVAANRVFLVGAPAVAIRHGTSFEMVAGLNCSTCDAWDHPLFNRVIGAGVLAPLDERSLNAIRTHYLKRGNLCNVEVFEGLTTTALVGLLDADGFLRSAHGLESHVLETDRAPSLAHPEIAVRQVEPSEYRRFGELVRDGFDMGADEVLGPFFVDLTVASLERLGDNGAAFIASVDGEDAGTGQLVLTERVAGCYSGSVLAPFRGRGIQKALIAARIRAGLARGRRIFVSQTDPDSPSGHNLRDLGFRTLYRSTWYTNPA